MTNHKPKRADMDVRSSEDRVIVTDPSGSAVRTTAGKWNPRWRDTLAGYFHHGDYISTLIFSARGARRGRTSDDSTD